MLAEHKDDLLAAHGNREGNLENAPTDFALELELLINRYSQETGSDTPDYVLAKYLDCCLSNFNSAVKARAAHHLSCQPDEKQSAAKAVSPWTAAQESAKISDAGRP